MQGLALRPGTGQMWAVEHGPGVDDEINLLAPGGNYGWDPVPGYDESVSMTDVVKFPSAIEANWVSGEPTIAPSGGIFLSGSDWGPWNGRLAVATLAGQSLRIFEFTRRGDFVSQIVVPELDASYGRLRTPMLGPDGSLYLTTSNGGTDRIIRVVPSLPPSFPAETGTQEVAENNSPSAVVASVAAQDPERRPLTYALSGLDAAFFTIASPSVGQVRARDSLDYETRASYEVVVTASDPYGLTDSVALTISVTDVNEAPVVSGPPVRNHEENSSGTIARYSADDPEGSAVEWSLSGADSEKFTITASGVLAFADPPDFEARADSNRDNRYQVIVEGLRRRAGGDTRRHRTRDRCQRASCRQRTVRRGLRGRR